jgi:uracil-DNA glycosylase family 4
VAKEKKRAYRDENYWGRPVPGFGDPQARLLILGLAPAAHGANRTGRMFTGDSSGDWLYRALYRAGFASQPTSRSRDDGMVLRDAYISATARCAPPDNRPSPEEIANCTSFLDAELRLLKQRKLILALGAIAFEAAGRMLQRNRVVLPKPRPRFQHLQLYDFSGERILTSYHPSRQNTQTGRLTPAMWEAVFVKARELLIEGSES